MDDLGLYLTVDPDGKLTGEYLSAKRIENEHLTGDAAHPAFVEVRRRVGNATAEQGIITFCQPRTY